MSEPSESDPRLRQLERRVDELAARLAALERHEPAATVPSLPASPATQSASESLALPSFERLHGLPALLGRTLVVMGGAFLLRSLAESGALSPALGVALGVAYALVWLLFADRAAARGHELSGTFHALASALIVYPLLVEAPTRLGLLGPAPAALLLALANAVGLAVAWRRDFRAIAWIEQSATLVVAVLLLFRTRSPLPFVAVLLLLAVASLVLAYRRGWRGQRWLVAIGVDLAIVLLAALRFGNRASLDWLDLRSVLLAQVGLASIYLGAFVLRLLVQSREVTPFAIFQTMAVALVGFEGALALGDAGTRRALALAALCAGVVLHGRLARRSERRLGHGVAVAYFSSLATFLAAEGVRVLLPTSVATLLWLLAAVALAALALAAERPIFQLHAALLTLAGSLVSGELAGSLAALVRPAGAPWPDLEPAHLAVLGLAAATVVLLYRGAARSGSGRATRAARLAVLAVALLGIGGLVIRVGAGADPGALAALRSAVLAGAAIGLAGAALTLRRRELVGFAWGVLAAGGAKLAIEDLRVAGAAHLVFSLALYGGALIAVPALARRLRRDAARTAA